MIAWGVAGLLAMGAILVAWIRLCRVRRALAFDAASLADAVERTPTRAGLRDLALAMQREGPSWEAQFVTDLLDAEGERAIVAITNEHLRDLAFELDWGAAIPGSAARIGLVGPMWVAFFELAHGRTAVFHLVVLFVWSAVGGAAPLWVGRAVSELLIARRAGVDRLVASCVRAARSGGGGQSTAQGVG
jgi:hypothetical protein